MTHAEKPIFEYSQITNSIFIGSNVCCRIHFDKRLLNKSITADVSLEEERLDTPYGAEFFIWLPVKDKHAPTKAQLDFGTDVINSLVKLNKKVYVHCMYGHGRSPTLVAAYLIKYQNMSVSEAIGLIKTKRPVVHLEEIQIIALGEFEKNKD